MDELFESARQGLDETGASPETREIVDALVRHGEEEGALLARYQRFGHEAAAPEVRYLVRLILDDERRHHRTMAEMANSLAWGLSGESPEAAVPDLTYEDADNAALTEETERLLAAEENDRYELKRLQKRIKPLSEITLWGLLLELMLLDTEKHARILRFILEHRQAPRH